MTSNVTVATLAKSEWTSGVLMICSFILAVCVSNNDFLSEYYVSFIFLPISFGHTQFIYESSLINLVNDGLMTLFFLLIGLELKYHLVLGEYQERKALVLPMMAAIGGVIVPAWIYTCFNFNTSTIKGWAIPIATDTAFMLGIISFFGQRVSSKLRAFIISFSLIDDALALMILAFFYTKSLNMNALLISVLFFTQLIILNHLKVKSNIYYLGIGVFLWFGMVKAGIHGTLAGAVLALTIPVTINEKSNVSFHKLENALRPLVYYWILPLFIFVNSGIRFDHFSQEMFLSEISLGIILGLFLGKQIGIAGFCYLGIKMKWCVLPEEINWKKFYAIAILGGVGFTLSFFIGDLTFESGEPHYVMRAAIIIGSVMSAILGILGFAYVVKQK